MKTEIKQGLTTKVSRLLEQLTLDEKIGMVHGAQLFQTAGVERLGIPPLKMSDGPMGVRQEFEPDNWMSVGNSNDVVSYLPCNSALAATWNRELAFDTGSVLGAEARGRGKDVILAPGINIKRSPLCGRNFEYFSEDPYLTGELAVPFIKGIQSWDVAACVKHFAANNQETQRLWVEVEVDEKALREIYLPAFYEAVTKGDSYSIMGAYNLIQGEHCCQSEYLLHDLLRKEWAYEGTVISDWGGVHDTELAAKSQLDIEMSVTDDFDQYFMAEPLKKKIIEGEISSKILDEKVGHILRLMMRLHMLEGDRKSGAYNTGEHHKKALYTARESVVLLKNSKNLLPLTRKNMHKLLVIGENADMAHANGGGSAEIKALYEITPLSGLTSLLGGNVQVEYVPGYCRDKKAENADANWQETSLEDGGGKTHQTQVDQEIQSRRMLLRQEAVALAGEYEHVIFVGGLNHDYDSEGIDRENMKLPYEQDRLISELLDRNPSTIITFVGGSPVEMGEWIHKAGAVVWSWYAGMEGGTALAEVLVGDVNPSGKLPETFYKNHMDCSAHALGEFPGGKSVRYTEGVFVGYRYNDTYHVEPEFCFGHGLSYTDFAYSEPAIVRTEMKMYLSCSVENTGAVAGKEVVQVYLALKEPRKDEPLQQLKGFDKVSLLSGEKKKVCIEIAGYSEDMCLRIGSSSHDIRLEL
ncbi:MAG: beta-glucosidase [Lachnospiraceae bacterium]